MGKPLAGVGTLGFDSDCSQGGWMRSSFPQDWLPAGARAGVFTAAQARAAGISKAQLAYRLRSRQWQRVAGAGIRRRTDALTPERLAYAAALTWPDAPVCGPSAVALLGAPVPLSPTVHVISASSRKPRLNIVPHELPLTRDETQMRGNILMTTPVRSFLDALVLLPEQQAQSLFVWSMTRDRLQVADFKHHLENAPGRWGNRRIRRFLADAQAGVMSRAEARAHKILRTAGITGWTTNIKVRDALGIICRADILFAQAKIVVGIDGRQYHAADLFQDERTQQNRLIAAGYAILRFTWQDLVERPNEMTTQIRTLTAARAQDSVD